MPIPVKRIAFLTADSLLRTALVAGLVLTFAWTLRQCARHQPTLHPDRTGTLTLSAADATLHGPPEIRLNIYQGKRNIGWWEKDTQWLSWRVDVNPSGPYQAELVYGRPWEGPVKLILTMGDQSLEASPPRTDARNQWSTFTLGTLDLADGHHQIVTLKVAEPPAGDVINFVSLRLYPADPTSFSASTPTQQK